MTVKALKLLVAQRCDRYELAALRRGSADRMTAKALKLPHGDRYLCRRCSESADRMTVKALKPIAAGVNGRQPMSADRMTVKGIETSRERAVRVEHELSADRMTVKALKHRVVPPNWLGAVLRSADRMTVKVLRQLRLGAREVN